MRCFPIAQWISRRSICLQFQTSQTILNLITDATYESLPATSFMAASSCARSTPIDNSTSRPFWEIRPVCSINRVAHSRSAGAWFFSPRREVLMKVKFSYRILFLVLVLAVLYFARPGNSFGQEPLPMDPLSPIGPKDYSECSSLQREWDNLYSQLDRMHEDCLESHRKNREKSNESGTGAGSRCAFP